MLAAHEIGRRSHDGTWLLKQVSLQIRPGERWAVAGPTGAGKTVLLRSLSLLDEIETGRLLWNDTEIDDADVPGFRSQVVYLHQRPVLFEGTVEVNLRVLETLRAHRDSTFDRGRVLELLGTLGRDADFLSKPSGSLSGGEGQIVALLRAMLLDPRILLLDEPTASLDSGSADAIEELVNQWFLADEQRRATVWVSHSVDQLGRMADKTIRLEAGEMKE